VEDVSAAELDGGRAGERVREADHAHVVGVLLEAGLVGAAVQAGKTRRLALHAAAHVAAGMQPAAGVARVLLALVVGAHVTDGQQARRAGGATEAAHAGRHGAGGRLGPGAALTELDQRLQRARVGQRQQPEELCPAATLVQIHLDCFLLLFAHLEHHFL